MAGKKKKYLILPYEAGCKTVTADVLYHPSSDRQLPVPSALNAAIFTLRLLSVIPSK